MEEDPSKTKRCKKTVSLHGLAVDMLAKVRDILAMIQERPEKGPDRNSVPWWSSTLRATFTCSLKEVEAAQEEGRKACVSLANPDTANVATRAGAEDPASDGDDITQ